MSAAEGKDWKWEIVDALDEFTESVSAIDARALEILLCDEGQLNIVWDSIRHLFPESRIRPGDELTALETGKLVGGFHSLWSAMLVNVEYHERLSKAAAETTAMRKRIDVVVESIAPGSSLGPDTGFIHLLESLATTEMIDAVRANRKRFETVIGTIFDFVRARKSEDFNAFMKGYGVAFACCPIDANGLPVGANRMAALISIFRPFLIKLGLSATDLQNCLDSCLPENEAPDMGRLSKYLQRRKAPLRRKGRPKK